MAKITQVPNLVVNIILGGVWNIVKKNIIRGGVWNIVKKRLFGEHHPWRSLEYLKKQLFGEHHPWRSLEYCKEAIVW